MILGCTEGIHGEAFSTPIRTAFLWAVCLCPRKSPDMVNQYTRFFRTLKCTRPFILFWKEEKRVNTLLIWSVKMDSAVYPANCTGMVF